MSLLSFKKTFIEDQLYVSVKMKNNLKETQKETKRNLTNLSKIHKIFKDYDKGMQRYINGITTCL